MIALIRDVDYLDILAYTASVQITQERLDEVLFALGEQLQLRGARAEIVVIGGSALLALGLATRATKDVDVVAVVGDGQLLSADPLPPVLQEASDRVRRDFDLQDDWLNPGPADLARQGLPDGFWTRVSTRRYGDDLTVHFAGRLDQIHFKLYAMVDHGGGRHEADLRALRPTQDELVAAAKWSTTHDPSDGYRTLLEQALRHLGVEDVDLGN